MKVLAVLETNGPFVILVNIHTSSEAPNFLLTCGQEVITLLMYGRACYTLAKYRTVFDFSVERSNSDCIQYDISIIN